MTIEIEVGGKTFGEFISASVQLHLDSLSSAFAFRTTSTDGDFLPIKAGQLCSVFVEEEKVLTGYIDLHSVNGSASEHAINVTGRDKTADILDSMIGVLPDIAVPVSLQTIVSKVISHIGSDSRVLVEDGLIIEDFTKAEDVISPEAGDNCFEFIERLARKKQVILSSDEEGNILIVRGDGKEVDAQIIHKLNGPENNVIQYDVRYDLSQRFNKYIVVSQLNVAAAIFSGTGELTEAEIVKQEAIEKDDDIRTSRQFVTVAESSSSINQAALRALWERKIRLARSKVYSVTVHGYQSQSGRLWAVNELVEVEDDFCDIKARMLVNKIIFGYSRDDGSHTILSFVNKDSYTLKLEEPEEIGDKLVETNPFAIKPSDQQ